MKILLNKKLLFGHKLKFLKKEREKKIFIAPTQVPQTKLDFLCNDKKQNLVLYFKEDVVFSDHFTYFPLKLLNTNLFFISNISNGMEKFIINFRLIARLFYSILKGLNQNFFTEYRVVGLGYKVFKYRRDKEVKIIRLRLGFSHIMNLKIPSNVHIITGKRRFLMISNSMETLRDLCFHLNLIKKPNSYKLKGLVLVKKEVKLKQGKQQQR